MRHRVWLLLCLILLFASPTWSFTDPVELESLVGEKLHFRVYWTGIPAATATLSVKKKEDGTYLLAARAKGLAVVQFIYPVKSRISSLVRGPDVIPLKFSKSGKEGWGKSKKREVVFNYEEATTEYYRDDKRSKKTVEIEPGIQDPLSVFFRFRIAELDEDKPYEVEVTDGKKRITGQVRVIGRETLETPAGTFDTIHVIPDLEGLGGVFAKSPDAELHMWLTDDQWRRPVKMQSEVSVGYFTMLLVDIDLPNSERPAPK